MTYSLALHLRSVELKDLTRVDDKVVELKNFITELLKTQIIDASLIYHSDQREIRSTSTKISDEEFNDINTAYLKAISFYNKKDYEKSIFYFDAIINKYNKYISSYDGFYNPVLYSELFLYRIYKKIYSSTMPNRRIINLLAKNIGGVSKEMLDSIIVNNSDIFTKKDVDFIQNSYFFYKTSVLDLLKSRPDYSSRGIFILSIKKNKYLYLLKRSDLHLSIYLMKSDKILLKLKEFKKRLTKMSFDLEINLDRFENKNFKESCCGIGFKLKINPLKFASIKEKVDQKLAVMFFSLLIVYFIILFSMGRYIYLLHKLQMVKDDFLNVISHELKTPLATIKLYADTIINTKDSNSTPRFAGIISSKTSQITNIISNMLYFNKLSDIKHSADLESRVQKNYQSVKIYPMVKKICEDYTNCYQKKFVLVMNDREFEFETDENLIRIVFSNLIDNSFKHDMKNDIKIRINSSIENGQIVVEYEDSVETVDKIDSDLIFNKFEMTAVNKKNSSSSRVAGNLGLGLYIVKNLLRLLNGSIVVEGENTLKFTIKLKMVEADEE